jgi:hypothetical protein
MTTNLTGTFTMTVEPNYKTFFDKYIGALVHVVRFFHCTFISPNQPIPQPVGIPMTPSSRLVPVEHFETASKRAELVSTLATLFGSVESSIVFGTTPFLFGPEHDETSVSPAWRNSLWHVCVICVSLLQPGTDHRSG